MRLYLARVLKKEIYLEVTDNFYNNDSVNTAEFTSECAFVFCKH